jgi:acetolactate synthase-1/2/3 large subunit
MKLTDYLVQFLVDRGIDRVFGLTGGAVVHLFESAAQHPGMTPVFCHHEQAAAFAAQAYARIRNRPGAAFVTTGPGTTNAMTGAAAAWLDSVPCIYFSGQTRLAHTTRNTRVRQIGIQQLDILKLVESITKYAVMIDDARMVRYHLEKAFHLATTGRPGPVWIDLPLDFQWAAIEPDTLPRFDPGERALQPVEDAMDDQVRRCADLFAQAKRPVVLAGYGVRLARGDDAFARLVEEAGIPFLASWNACDMMPASHPLNVGRPGVFGQRGANLAMQNCDLLVAIGSHLCLSITGTLFDAFARDATIVMVDADKDELDHRTVRVDLPVHSDARQFLIALLRARQGQPALDVQPWRDQCAYYARRHNSVPLEWRNQPDLVNPYVFMDMLSDELAPDDQVVVDGGGTVNQIAFQAMRLSAGQRMIISAAMCAMGSGLPESVGAACASGRGRTVCLSGDGSMQLNIHELQTIVHHKLPVKVFVFNNDGYLSIRITQDGFLDRHHVGSSREGGMSLPDFVRVAEAYGLKTERVRRHDDLRDTIRRVLAADGPVLCDVMVSKDQDVAPRQAFERKPDGTFTPRPLEDMDPLLDDDEFLTCMMVRPWKGSLSRLAAFDARRPAG